jgi:E3 SUMO-protein ligase PIAS1
VKPLTFLQTIRHNIKHNTVEKLKQILTRFNEECQTHHTRSGKKQDHIDRIISSLDQWRANNSEDKWTKAKTIIAQVRSNGMCVSYLTLHPSLMHALSTIVIVYYWFR